MKRRYVIYVCIIALAVLGAGAMGVHYYRTRPHNTTKSIKNLSKEDFCGSVIREEDLTQLSGFTFVLKEGYQTRDENTQVVEQGIIHQCYYSTNQGPGMRVVSVIVSKDADQQTFALSKLIDQSNPSFESLELADSAYIVVSEEKAFGVSAQTLDIVAVSRGLLIRIHTPVYVSLPDTKRFLTETVTRFVQVYSIY